MNWVRAITSPWGTLSTSIFAALWGITSRYDESEPAIRSLVSANGPSVTGGRPSPS